MNIPKATRDLQARVNGELYIQGRDKCEDIKLSIKALERIEDWRKGKILNPDLLLQGETLD